MSNSCHLLFTSLTLAWQSIFLWLPLATAGRKASRLVVKRQGLVLVLDTPLTEKVLLEAGNE